MARAATGQIIHNADGYSARVRVGPKARPQIAIFAATETEAEARAGVLADIAKRLRSVAAADEIAELLTEAGKARTGKALSVVLEAVEAIAFGTTTKASSAVATTFEAFAKEWTSKALHKRFPDHVREKDSSGDVLLLRDHVTPVLGPKRLPDITLEDAEQVMRSLPASLAPRTRLKIAQCMRKVLSLAVYPGRHIPANPIPREWMPRIPKSANKAKSCLWPDEDAKLARCTKVPLERRIAYGILTREGMRASELGTLHFRDLDLEKGRVRLDANKTDDPRAWALSPDVVRVLAWWKKRQGAEDGDLVLNLDFKAGAAWLRGKTWDPKTRHANTVGDLRTAGVDRAELFERSARRQPIRLHDLRASFVTTSLANGKTEQWVTDRTGHKSSQMVALYARQAREWSELDLGPFQPLDELLPEMRAERGRAVDDSEGEAAPSEPPAEPPPALEPEAGSLGVDWALDGVPGRIRTCDHRFRKTGPAPAIHGASEKKALRQTRSNEIAPPEGVDAQSTSNRRADGSTNVEPADPLERALLLAAEAGRFDVVAQLAKELEARRLAGSNVAPLRAAKKA